MVTTYTFFMKPIFFILALFLSIGAFAQKKLPVIRATSKRAQILEANNPVSRWGLSPETKPDVYVTNKLTAPTPITFKTDIDSLTFTLKPGGHKDFIVLLNGKDSCYTRIESPFKSYARTKPEIHDTIPYVMNNQNTAYVKVVIAKADTLNLNFDTGATELTILEEPLKNKVKTKLDLYNTVYDIQIGNRTYNTKIYDNLLAGHDTDGLFGWDIFDGLIVELNYDNNQMVIHSKLPKAVKRDKNIQRLNLKYFNRRFFIEAEIAHAGTTVKDWFLFDSGYQRTVMLDNDILKEQKFPADEMKVIKKVTMRGASGKEVPVITAGMESLKIGKFELKDIPVQIMTTNKTLFGANIHILGNEVLKRFNVFLDFQENVVYLQPNHLFNAGYIEKT